MPEAVERLARLRPLVCGPCFLLPLALLCEPELLFNVNLQVRLRDLGEGDADAPRGLVFKQNLCALDRLDAPAEVALAADGAARLHPCRAPREALEVREPVEPALKPRRGDFEGVGGGDEVFHVEHGAEVRAYLGAVFVGDAARLVDEDADDGRARAAGEFDVDEFEAALLGRASRDLAHARFDGSLPVQSPSRNPPSKTLGAKEKVGRKPTGNATALRARGGLYGNPARVATRETAGDGRRAARSFKADFQPRRGGFRQLTEVST